MKKITLLGDSIRLIGYGKKVADSLENDGYKVFQPDENCRFAKYTLRMLYDYKNEIAGSDVIHWNNGLWDVCNLFGDGTFSSLADYKKTIIRELKILKEITPNIIFATTTPVRDDNPNNNNDIIKKFNAEIVPVLKTEGCYINDLYNLLYEKRNLYIRDDDKIHLTASGIEVCHQAVYGCIKSVLRKSHSVGHS